MDSRRTRPHIVMAIGCAIAFAEGFYRAGTVPRMYNNPGDLKHAPDAYKIIDKPVSGILHFDTLITGWGALYNQVHLMLDNESSVYNSSMTIEEVGKHWTATMGEQQGWAISVAWFLRVPVDTRLFDIERRMGDVCEL